jgi:hypothetical protein
MLFPKRLPNKTSLLLVELVSLFRSHSSKIPRSETTNSRSGQRVQNTYPKAHTSDSTIFQIQFFQIQISIKKPPYLLPFFASANAGASSSGKKTRYWHCCKSSCSWPSKVAGAAGATTVQTCDINDSPLTDFSVASGCNGGTAYQWLP